jgi:hypothetical protein
MKVNTETTKKERLRLLVGVTLAIAGAITVTIIGAIYGYQNVTVWVIGLSLIFIGAATAKSVTLANFLNSILRF